MATATITSKGQVTIPKKIRDKLGLKPGDKINFELNEQGKLEVSTKTYSIMDTAGILYRPGQKRASIEDMNKAIGEAIKERHERS
ncbi:MAG TPA: AbrB family transcriptional regulator [Balneolaceae bacterium]|nr:AbrB family transcriptional regulator [Balneola sp.]HBQ61397.1 AbrB family transcriptional regulator [Balneolaceae bacterium]|tara:strand:- start:42906 stop:43160 length:255 start_codon:yes stop_codon:yes gene_type:complete